MTSTNITFSAVIPSYERPVLVRRAVQSVLDQSYPAREVIVIDNGRNRLDPASLPSGVQVIQAPTGIGVSQARNVGVALSSSEFVAFLDDDDFWHRDYLSAVANAMGRQRNVSVFVGSRYSFDTGKAIDPTKARIPTSVIGLIRRNPGIIGSTLVVRRHDLLALGGFDARLTAGEDSDLAIRARKSALSMSYVSNAIAYYSLEQDNRRLTGRVARLFEAKRTLVRKHVANPLVGFVLIVDYAARLALARTRARLRQ